MLRFIALAPFSPVAHLCISISLNIHRAQASTTESSSLSRTQRPATWSFAIMCGFSTVEETRMHLQRRKNTNSYGRATSDVVDVVLAFMKAMRRFIS